MRTSNTIGAPLLALEGRIVPATFPVTNLADSGPGSLRQAVIDANGNSGMDTVAIQMSISTATEILLTSGQITITDPVKMVGPGSSWLQLTGNNSSRMFVVNADSEISGFYFYGGRAKVSPSIGFGGAILSTANLTIVDCGFELSWATNAGGAIYQTGSQTILAEADFFSNQATNSGGQGGAIYATGTVSLFNTVFQQNIVTGTGSGGGGLYLASGILTFDNSTFRSNLANSGGSGGAIYSAGATIIRNSTIDSGSASKGGGLYLTAGGTLWNCTVAYNGNPSATGGGIWGNVTLESTIVNKNNGSSGPDIFGSAAAKNSSIGSASGFAFTDNGDNLAFGLDPMFRQVFSGYFGGTVISLPLLANSPCKDKGSNPGGLSYDLRGPGFPRTVGLAPDIGAFEIQTPPKVTVQLNDGSVQRSRITSFAITFDEDFIATTSGIINACELKRVAGNAIVGLSLAGGEGPPDTNTTQTYDFTFISGPLDGTSLSDGVYILTVFGTNIIDASGQNLDGNGDGTGGDDYISPTTVGHPNRIFRLFGDATGDASVSIDDFNLFRMSFGGYDFAFDFNGDGSIGNSDFNQFKTRFGASI